jgi:hypothetical protein
MADFEGAEEALRAVEANTSPRYKRLEKLEHWVSGTQYAGLKSWWDDAVPLWERAPCIVYPVAHIAIQSNVDLVLGEGRFPSFSTKPDQEEADEESGTDGDASEDIDRFIVEHHRMCRFRAHCRDALAAAQSCGTAVAIHGARDGRPFADIIPAKWGTPQLGLHGEVLSLEIRYPYLDEYKKPSGVWAVRAKLYRRVIDAQRDITYLPANADPNGVEPSWQEDPHRSTSHGFGFCPSVWYPFMRGCLPVNVIDGKALHGQLLDEIRAHDIALSQRHRGALYSEPQMCEIGVMPGYNPTDVGRQAMLKSVDDNGNVVGAFRDTGGNAAPARKKGPTYVNQYEDPQTRVEYLCYPGEALKAQDENAADLLNKLQAALGVVLLDPNHIKFAATTSGKALEAIKQTQVDRCDQYRDDVRDGFLLPSVDMQLRIAQKLGAGLRVPGIDKVAPALAKFVEPDPVPARSLSAVAG